jgi:hypothetical protein
MSIQRVIEQYGFLLSLTSGQKMEGINIKKLSLCRMA